MEVVPPGPTPTFVQAKATICSMEGTRYLADIIVCGDAELRRQKTG
jgi:hypothetical protein